MVSVNTGVVERVSQRDPQHYGVYFDMSWYNGFGKCPCAVGDEVYIEYETKMTFKNILNIKVTKQSIPGSTDPAPNKPELTLTDIQNTMKSLVTYMASIEELVKSCVEGNAMIQNALNIQQGVQVGS